MRILLTGGAGFIGSHLADRFSGDGHEVLLLDDLSTGRRTNVPGHRLEVADVRERAAADIVRGFAPEALCHHAAQMDVRRSVEDPAFDVSVNLVGLVQVLEAARRGGALAHVLFASSGGAMYGEQETFPATEAHPVRPASPYGLAKAVSEEYLALFERMYGIAWTALRYANVYGPRQTPKGEAGVVAIFGSRMLAGDGITVFGDGEQTRDFVFVGDVVEANVLALDRRLRGGFNVGTGVETSVNDLQARLQRLAGSSVPVERAPARLGEQQRSVIDPAKLVAEGWAPRTTLDDGLARTLAWLGQGA